MLKSGEGAYMADEATLDELEAGGQVWPGTPAATRTARPATSPAW